MKVRVLGCSGGIGGGHLRTTSLLVDEDILIDAGTGVGELPLAELALIDHVFLTHAHLDHVACLPFIVDTVGDLRDRPLTLHATRATLEVIRAHVFNWAIWPDFARIPDPDRPFLRYAEIEEGQTTTIDGRGITALPANHTVPAVGYQLDSGRASLVFSGDTTVCDGLWSAVNRIGNLRYLIVETAFCDRERQLAVVAKHLCPQMLKEELLKLRREAEIYITHLKPGHIELIMREVEERIGEYKPRMLENNQVFEL